MQPKAVLLKSNQMLKREMMGHKSKTVTSVTKLEEFYAPATTSS